MSPLSLFSVAPAEFSDFEAILVLQHENHVSQLPEIRLSAGFVTTQLTLQSLESMRANSGLWVARASSGEVVAYTCANDWDFYGESPFQNSARTLLPLEFDRQTIEIPFNTGQSA